MAALFAVQAKNAAVCMQPGARVVVRWCCARVVVKLAGRCCGHVRCTGII